MVGFFLRRRSRRTLGQVFRQRVARKLPFARRKSRLLSGPCSSRSGGTPRRHGACRARLTGLRKLLEGGRAETRPGFNLAYCLRMGTAYFAWFFEGVYQHIKKEGLYKT